MGSSGDLLCKQLVLLPAWLLLYTLTHVDYYGNTRPLFKLCFTLVSSGLSLFDFVEALTACYLYVDLKSCCL